MRYTNLIFVLGILLSGCTKTAHEETSFLPEKITISRAELANKIKGGWAGQVIGCTYGGPTEFRFKGTMIQDYTPILWDSTRMLWWYENAPGLYDDVYMDLTFVDVFEKKGLDAEAKDHGEAFANAEYWLWHANQAARYNILNGMNPPNSGFWKNNPHADDIDFQIEADFAGLMCPGMPNTSSGICDKVGHIMNYGDGWYGGVYVAAMYSLSFVTKDISFIVTEALKSIPQQSTFYQCMEDVIQWHKEFPNDWKRTWFEVERKWSSDIGCPDGVFSSFNIDAKINAAYILIGLLYGNGDFGKTLDISTRCGQDSDCNPASAGGILGTIVGYDSIPAYWKQGIGKVEDMDFRYTTMSLKDVYNVGLKHALGIIEKNKGVVGEETIEILVQKPEPVKLEVGFDGLKPVNVQNSDWNVRLDKNNPLIEFEFTGKGFVLSGEARKDGNQKDDKILEVEVRVDGNVIEIAKLTTSFIERRHDICWNYDLKEGKHTLQVKLMNPSDGYYITPGNLLIYSGI